MVAGLKRHGTGKKKPGVFRAGSTMRLTWNSAGLSAGGYFRAGVAYGRPPVGKGQEVRLAVLLVAGAAVLAFVALAAAFAEGFLAGAFLAAAFLAAAFFAGPFLATLFFVAALLAGAFLPTAFFFAAFFVVAFFVAAFLSGEIGRRHVWT